MAIKFYDSPFHVTHDVETASKMTMKMDFSIMLGKLIKKNGWTQEEAAAHLGVTQSRISDLVNNKIEKFTLDVMFDMLDKMGFRAKVSMRDIDTQDEAQIKIQRVAIAC